MNKPHTTARSFDAAVDHWKTLWLGYNAVLFGAFLVSFAASTNDAGWFFVDAPGAFVFGWVMLNVAFAMGPGVDLLTHSIGWRSQKWRRYLIVWAGLCCALPLTIMATEHLTRW